MRRAARPARAVAAAAAVAAVAGLAAPAAALPRGWAAADVHVESVSRRGVTFAGRTMTQLSGEVVNAGSVDVGQVEIVARFRAAPGGAVLATGTTVAMLTELAPDERSPFLLLVGPLDVATVGDVEIIVHAPASPGVRERDLAVEGVVTRTVAGAPAVFGHLVNRGPRTASATHTNVVAAFWDAAGLRELRAATMPILYQPGTIAGQGHPPGVAYPWFLRLPDEPWTRLDWLVVARRYADGAWPVPLGIVDVVRDDDGATPRFVGRLVGCGLRPAADFALVSSVVDAAGVVTFSLAAGELRPPLPPGGSRPIELRWPGIGPAVGAADVALLALALDDQPLPPREMPCTRAAVGAWQARLPALLRVPAVAPHPALAPPARPTVDPPQAGR